MAADNSDSELVIDESIVLLSSDEEYESNIFHPMSITSADLQAELFHEDTSAEAELFHEDDANTCSICNESFRYNVALICHMEMEHVANKPSESSRAVKRKKNGAKLKKVKNKYVEKVKLKPPTRTFSEQIVRQNSNKVSTMTCEGCRKKFSDENKRLKHQEEGLKFTCMFCNLKFCWESKYKKHLHRKHKLNAVVICKLCSSVFEDMIQLAGHALICPKKAPDTVAIPEESDDLSVDDVAIVIS